LIVVGWPFGPLHAGLRTQPLRLPAQAAIADNKWARCGWAASDEEEERVKEETGATLRCFPFEQPPGPHTCLMSGNAAAEVCLFAKSY
jgi:prolyl-tRNA synthetase